MSAHELKPTHKAVKTYYEALQTYARQEVDHEGAVRSAFQNLLDEVGRRHGWTLIPELGVPGTKGRTVYPAATAVLFFPTSSVHSRNFRRRFLCQDRAKHCCR
jgi:hypothetical protein